MKKKMAMGLVFLGMIFLVNVVCPTAHAALTVAGNKKGLLQLGSQAPDFKLQDVVTGKEVTLSDFKDQKALLVIILCRHCPFVQHVKEGIAKLGTDYQGKGLGIVGISANDPAGYPEDAPAKLKEMAQTAGFVFPVLFDGTQQVAKKYTALATPDFFLFDPERKLVYRGQFDASRPGNGLPVTGKDVREAIDSALAGKPVLQDQTPSMGCSIKWKPDNTPKYR